MKAKLASTEGKPRKEKSSEFCSTLHAYNNETVQVTRGLDIDGLRFFPEHHLQKYGDASVEICFARADREKNQGV